MKAVVGFEDTGRIKLFHCAYVEQDGVAVGTLGADTCVVRLRVVPIRKPDFAYRLLVAAGSDTYQAVEYA